MVVIGWGMGGFRAAAAEALLGLARRLAADPRAHLALYFFSYTFIPLSAIAFPHITIFCLTARKMAQFKKTVIFYPLCIMAIWLPCVFLGVMANRVQDVPADQGQAGGAPRAGPAGQADDARAARRAAREDGRPTTCCCCCSTRYAPLWLAGLLGAGIMAAVMATDSQILALSTMFTEDVLHALRRARSASGRRRRCRWAARFVVLLTVVAYLIALTRSGEHLLAGHPVRLHRLRRALAAAGGRALLEGQHEVGRPGLHRVGGGRGGRGGRLPGRGAGARRPARPSSCGGSSASTRWRARPGGTAVFGFMPVVPMVLVSALLMLVVSALTPKPSAATIARYFR